MTPSSKLFRSAGAALLLVAALSGCGGGDDEPTVGTTGPGATGAPGSSAPAGVTTDKVAVKDFAFKPEVATVKAGTTVTWSFDDDVNHNVEPVGGAEPKKSDDLKGGKTSTHTFEKAGTFAYRCGIHNSMAGTVVVTA